MHRTGGRVADAYMADPTLLDRRLKVIGDRPAGTLVIHEVYRSLQGEGTRAGLPCIFVRLSACHMRCGYCDTPHAFREGTAQGVDEVASAVLAMPDNLVQITGGEPLLQEEVHLLIGRVLDAGRVVLLETGGGVDTSAVDPRVHVILDVKTPGSGEERGNHWPNLDRLKPIDEVKFVICDRPDFDYALRVIERFDLAARVPVLLGAAFGRVELAELAAWILETALPLRLQVQLHKLIWDPTARGV